MFDASARLDVELAENKRALATQTEQVAVLARQRAALEAAYERLRIDERSLASRWAIMVGAIFAVLLAIVPRTPMPAITALAQVAQTSPEVGPIGPHDSQSA